MISGVSLSPKRQRMGLYYQCHDNNIGHVEVCAFLRDLLRHLRGHVIVLWDNAAIHKGQRMRDLCRQLRRLHLERLPAYAPELNPDEDVWAQTKRKLANGRPDDIGELLTEVLAALLELKHSQRKLRACIHKSELPLFLH